MLTKLISAVINFGDIRYAITILHDFFSVLALNIIRKQMLKHQEVELLYLFVLF
jgi:hypothetical protein